MAEMGFQRWHVRLIEIQGSTMRTKVATCCILCTPSDRSSGPVEKEWGVCAGLKPFGKLGPNPSGEWVNVGD